MPIDLDDPKMEGFTPLQQYRDLDSGASSRRIREDSKYGPLTQFEVEEMFLNILNAKIIANIINQPLSVIESLATGAKSDVVTIAAPGAVPGDKVTISRISSGLSSDPRYLISARAVTNAVQLTVANMTPSTYDFTAELISIHVTR